jgi:hypothetical protein
MWILPTHFHEDSFSIRLACNPIYSPGHARKVIDALARRIQTGLKARRYPAKAGWRKARVSVSGVGTGFM